jgi:hypothetical protein
MIIGLVSDRKKRKKIEFQAFLADLVILTGARRKVLSLSGALK